ncbi:hypothetical protein D9611_006548 [Ephemerocybe angulata]|uniref:DUF6534 domain-containing protein n=1 Tax=Ephemerocybe angulata TaxID=980116 RepID=A0A8H5C7A9_9AGAR|nr:hypothetical protein D9611_006548 [Tulosesus angulatus]
MASGATLPGGVSLGDIQVLLALVSPLLSSLLLSYLFTYGLQGILIVQVYNYYISFPNDRLFWKILVYVVLFAELLQTILASIDAFHIFSSGWGKFQLLDDLNLLFLTPIMSASIGLVCHCVFAYRLYTLSGSKMVCLTVILLWNGAGAGCDVAIAGLMTFYLSRSSTGYKTTDVLLTRIIRMTIETGLFTATASLASAILFVGYRENFKVSIYFIVPAIMLAKLYAVTILAMFNNRVVAIRGLGHAAVGSIGSAVASVGMRSHGGGETGMQTFTPEIRIGRSVVQQVWTDDMAVKHVRAWREAQALSVPSAFPSLCEVNVWLTGFFLSPVVPVSATVLLVTRLPSVE